MICITFVKPPVKSASTTVSVDQVEQMTEYCTSIDLKGTYI